MMDFCSVCDGTGMCPFGNPEQSEQFRCSACGGTGKVEPEQNAKSKCNICSSEFFHNEEGVIGYIGIINFGLCQTCLNGVRDMVEKNYICPHCERMAGDEDV